MHVHMYIVHVPARFYYFPRKRVDPCNNNIIVPYACSIQGDLSGGDGGREGRGGGWKEVTSAVL